MDSKDKFLSYCLGYAVYDYDHSIELKRQNAIELKRQNERSMYQIKTNYAYTIKNLIEKKFRFITTSITFMRNYSIGCIPSDSDPLPYTDDILRIASTSFKDSRFHQDQLISKEQANFIKEKWAYNCIFEDRADRCFLVFEEDILVGFLFSILEKNNVHIDLIAVDEKYKGKGYGSILVNKFIRHYYNMNYFVTTQMSNYAAINLYLGNEFKVVDYKMVFHKHIGV